MTTAFSAEAFLTLIRQRGLRYGQPFTLKQQTTSTNDEALAALKAGGAAGTLFVAEQQTQGRGRQGRQWHSVPSDSLTFSIILRPQVVIERLSAVTLIIGLAVRDALASYGGSALQIKWPNDIVHQRLKVAGILTEKPQGLNRGDTGLVVGVGINLGSGAVPTELAAQAISLAELGALQLSRESVLADLMQSIERRITEFETLGLAPLLQSIRAHDALNGEAVSVDQRTGVARGIGEHGELLLECNGTSLRLTAGTVAYN